MAGLKPAKEIIWQRLPGKKVVLGPLEVRVGRISEKSLRCHFVLSKQIFSSAVKRNRWKRIAREIIRRHQSQLPLGYELVVRLRLPPSQPLFYKDWEEMILRSVILAIQSVTNK
jgi:ribonuclease P protein component